MAVLPFVIVAVGFAVQAKAGVSLWKLLATSGDGRDRVRFLKGWKGGGRATARRGAVGRKAGIVLVWVALTSVMMGIVVGLPYI